MNLRGTIYDLRLVRVGLILCMVLGAHMAVAQKKVKLEQADKLKGGKKGDEKYQRLLGNVILTQSIAIRLTCLSNEILWKHLAACALQKVIP